MANVEQIFFVCVRSSSDDSISRAFFKHYSEAAAFLHHSVCGHISYAIIEARDIDVDLFYEQSIPRYLPDMEEEADGY